MNSQKAWKHVLFYLFPFCCLQVAVRPVCPIPTSSSSSSSWSQQVWHGRVAQDDVAVHHTCPHQACTIATLSILYCLLPTFCCLLSTANTRFTTAPFYWLLLRELKGVWYNTIIKDLNLLQETELFFFNGGFIKGTVPWFFFLLQ